VDHDGGRDHAAAPLARSRRRDLDPAAPTCRRPACRARTWSPPPSRPTRRARQWTTSIARSARAARTDAPSGSGLSRGSSGSRGSRGSTNADAASESNRQLIFFLRGFLFFQGVSFFLFLGVLFLGLLPFRRSAVPPEIPKDQTITRYSILSNERAYGSTFSFSERVLESTIINAKRLADYRFE
jgi:hypothetical protein